MTVDLLSICKTPQIRIKGTILFLNLFYDLSIFPDAVNLIPISYDTGI